MATLYTRVYTYTGRSSTSSACTVSKSNFTITGDTTHTIRKINSISLAHAHSSTGSNVSWGLTAQLVFSNGTYKNAGLETHTFNRDIYTYTSTWPTANLPTPAEFANLSSIKVINSNQSSATAVLSWRATQAHPMVLTVTFYDSVYEPQITNFEVWRVDANGSKKDDGNRLYTTIRLARAKSGTSTLKLHYSTGNVSESSPYFSFSATNVTNMLSRDVTSGITNISFSAGSSHNLLLVHSIGDEKSTARVTIPRAFAALHISGCENGGVAIGGYSGSTDSNPMFEVFHPIYPYGGIVGIGPEAGDVIEFPSDTSVASGYISNGGKNIVFTINLGAPLLNVNNVIISGSIVVRGANGYVTQAGYENPLDVTNSALTRTVEILDKRLGLISVVIAWTNAFGNIDNNTPLSIASGSDPLTLIFPIIVSN